MRVGTVDVGSNALRCLVVEGEAGEARFRVLEDRREAVRLGADVFGGAGWIAQVTAAQAVDALRSFARDFRRLKVDEVRAVATAAVREARNRREFLARLQRETGIAVEAVSGAEEARLVALAAVSRVPRLREGRHVVMDVGGGSAEVIVVEDGEVARADSFELGAVRLLRELGAGPSGERFLALARVYVDSFRPPLRALLGRPAPETFSATGGNIESLARIVGRRSDAGRGVHEVRVKALEGLLVEMARLSPLERMERWSLRVDRADVIVPAGVVYARFAAAAGVDRLLVPHVGLRDALALDLLLGGRRRGARPGLDRARVASALAVGRKFHFDERHARRVADFALAVFDRSARAGGLEKTDRHLLQAAALLHDVGIAVSPVRHHRHSAYLIRESEIAGVTPREQEVIAQVARYHRRGLPREGHAEYESLRPSDRRRVACLAGILRIADALDRERGRPLEGVDVSLRAGRLDLRLRGRGDRLLELWAVDRKKGLFEREFGVEVRARKVPGGP